MTTLPLTKLERFVPLTQAAKRSGLSEETLRHLAEAGKVRAAVLPGGEIGIGEQSARQVASYEQINERLRSIRREDFKKLKGKLIFPRFSGGKVKPQPWLVRSQGDFDSPAPNDGASHYRTLRCMKRYPAGRRPAWHRSCARSIRL
jgi:hypothetical protein